MNANVSFRNMDSSTSLRSYATDKLERICDKYVQGKVDASVVMTVEKFWHIANFTLQIKNLTVKGQERSEDMYSSIDLALDKIEKQLRRHKDRLRDHKPTNGEAKMFKMGVLTPLSPPQIGDPPLNFEAGHYDSEFEEDYELYPGPDEETGAEDGEVDKATIVATANGDVKVLRQEMYEAKPMTVDEAVLQLELMEDRQFFVFTNAESDNINVVYRRDDIST
jgi:putative sigma-54 modulation protein